MNSKLAQEALSQVQQIEIRTRRLVKESLAGHYHSVFKGAGMNFDRVREYVPGDQLSTIDWNVTARTRKPFVKVFTEERELTIMLVIDVSSSEDFGSVNKSKRQLLAELASVLALSAVQNNDKVGLLLFSDQVELYIPAARGRTHILRLIREILFFKPLSDGTNLVVPLEHLNRLARRGTITFLISDFCVPQNFSFEESGFSSAVRATNQKHDLVAISIRDPREEQLPDIGYLTLEDSETGEQIEINTSSKLIRETFAELSQKEHQTLKLLFRSFGVDLLEVSTGEDYLPALLRFFSSREKRRASA